MVLKGREFLTPDILDDARKREESRLAMVAPSDLLKPAGAIRCPSLALGRVGTPDV